MDSIGPALQARNTSTPNEEVEKETVSTGKLFSTPADHYHPLATRSLPMPLIRTEQRTRSARAEPTDPGGAGISSAPPTTSFTANNQPADTLLQPAAGPVPALTRFSKGAAETRAEYLPLVLKEAAKCCIKALTSNSGRPNSAPPSPEQQLARAIAKWPQMVAMYRKADIPLNARTVCIDLHDENLVSEMRLLKHTGLSKVYTADYAGKNGGPARSLIFKWEATNLGFDIDATGINLMKPRFYCRNLAVARLNERLGWNVIPKTQIAIHDGNPGIAMEIAAGRQPTDRMFFDRDVTDTKIGLQLMAHREVLLSNPNLMRDQLKILGLHSIRFLGRRVKISGAHPAPEAVPLFKGGSVMRELIKLQIIDALTAQSDRHGLNYFIDPVSGRVSGIDNDQSFGPNIRRSADLAARMTPYSFFCVGLPTVVDLEMVKNIINLTADDIEAELGDLLLPEEIEATQARLEEIHNHFQHLAMTNRIIQPDQWERQVFDDGTTSYIARDSKGPSSAITI
ncbi:MAG: hypothetical protein JWQ23_3652 [Herminiimonas sp.]|nr:hypothetical protein [Herminiimonas sp.]